MRQRPTSPQARFLPLEAFGRRPANKRHRPSSGRHPKPYTSADLVWVLRNSDFKPNLTAATAVTQQLEHAKVGTVCGSAALHRKPSAEDFKARETSRLARGE